MSNKLISTITTLSVIWILVYYTTATGMIHDEMDGPRFLGKVSCEKVKAHINAERKRDCGEHMPCRNIMTTCISAKDYIPPVRRK